MLFHTITQVSPLPEYRLSVQFAAGCTKIYDMKPLFDRLPSFRHLREHPAVCSHVRVDIGGYGVAWDDELDLSCDELWEHGVEVKTPCDGLMA